MRVRTPDDRRQALVLVALLWILAVVGLVAVTFSFHSQTELKASYYARRRLEAQMLAESAIERARVVVDQDDPAADSLAEPWADAPDLFADVPLGASAEAVMSVIGSPDDDHEFVRYGLVDESGKINLNTATRDMLLALPGVTEEIADAILDWRDGDDNPRTFGAESAYYATLTPAYSAKNEPFESVEELLLVRGVTSRLLYGEDANRNGILDPNEDDRDETPPDDDGDGTLDVGLYRYVTVWSRTPNVDAQGQPRINLNGPWQQLQQPLMQLIGNQAIVRRIVEQRRRGTTFSSTAALLDIQGMTEELYVEIADQLTTSEATVLRGLVNPNTAPPAVLRALPGLTDEDVAALVAVRETDKDSLTSAAWVLPVVGRAKFRNLANLLTVRSSQFSCEAVGRFTDGPVFKRLWVVLDRQTPPARIVYWQDLTGLGLAYPPAQAGKEPAAPRESF